MHTFGFIGTGRMGGAVAKALAKSVPAGQIYLHNRTEEKAQSLAAQLGCHTATLTRAAECDYVFLGVKPQNMAQLLQQLAPILAEKPPILVSMAAGLTIADLQTMAGGSYGVIRIMPNTPVEVSCGMISYCASENVPAAALEIFVSSMAAAGVLDALPEEQMDAGTAVAGCGPAFAYLFLEALTRGGEQCGLSREKALTYATQMLLGAARLAQETGTPPAQLREAVCSPGGSTIEGVRKLQAEHFCEAVEHAVQASYRRNQELRK